MRSSAGTGAVYHETLIGGVFQNDMEMFCVDRYADPVPGFVFLYLPCRIDKSLDTFMVCAKDY